jgi:hypothetical protein
MIHHAQKQSIGHFGIVPVTQSDFLISDSDMSWWGRQILPR